MHGLSPVMACAYSYTLGIEPAYNNLANSYIAGFIGQFWVATYVHAVHADLDTD